jgi:NADH-quinone oxidoreductase subunit J
MIAQLAFYMFAGILLVSAGMVVSARNPVHSVLYLVLAFFNAAALFLLAGAEFLAMILVIVYVGAVAVLFLFVVMMLDIRIDRVRQGFWKHFPVAAFVGAVVALEMALVLMAGFGTVDEAKPVAELLNKQGEVLPYSNTQALGRLLYTQYLYPVEIAAILLLVAMITAIALTMRKRKDTNKAINPAIQVRVRAQDRISLVKMEATKAPVAAAAEGETAVEEKK